MSHNMNPQQEIYWKMGKHAIYIDEDNALNKDEYRKEKVIWNAWN